MKMYQQEQANKGAQPGGQNPTDQGGGNGGADQGPIEGEVVK